MTTNRSPEYAAAVNAAIEADNTLADATIAELRRLMPEHVAVVHVYLNDTPRLAVEDWLDADGESVLDETHPAFDAMDDAALNLGWREFEDADNYLLRVSDEVCAWKIERETGDERKCSACGDSVQILNTAEECLGCEEEQAKIASLVAEVRKYVRRDRHGDVVTELHTRPMEAVMDLLDALDPEGAPQ